MTCTLEKLRKKTTGSAKTLSEWRKICEKAAGKKWSNIPHIKNPKGPIRWMKI